MLKVILSQIYIFKCSNCHLRFAWNCSFQVDIIMYNIICECVFTYLKSYLGVLNSLSIIRCIQCFFDWLLLNIVLFYIICLLYPMYLNQTKLLGLCVILHIQHYQSSINGDIIHLFSLKYNQVTLIADRLNLVSCRYMMHRYNITLYL
jgi:hypothetical protein